MMPFKKISAFLLVAVSALAMSSCSSEQSQDQEENKALRPQVRQGTLKEAISSLKVAPENAKPGYSRTKFQVWSDLDGNGCNTREDILIAEATEKPNVTQPGCEITGGKWLSWFDNQEVTDATNVSVDHLVPLAEAWRSGASEWDKSKRTKFGNDTDYGPTLTAVTPKINSLKGDKDPASWLPPHAEATCAYAASWVATKIYWELTADSSEITALNNLKKCLNLTTEWKTTN